MHSIKIENLSPIGDDSRNESINNILELNQLKPTKSKSLEVVDDKITKRKIAPRRISNKLFGNPGKKYL